jgi:hypothetical protein
MRIPRKLIFQLQLVLFPGMLLSMMLLKRYKDAVMLWQKVVELIKCENNLVVR